MGDPINKISIKELNKLPLEERAKRVLHNYVHERAKIQGEESLISFVPYLEAWAYLEKEGHVEVVGGTPKSGVAYKVTEKGKLFID